MMTPVTQLLLFLSYGVIALAIALLPPRMSAADPIIWSGAGALFFMLAVLATHWWLMRRQQGDVVLKLEKMQSVNAILRHDLERVRRDMENLQGHDASSEVLSELKVLQTLLNRIVEKNVPLTKADGKMHALGTRVAEEQQHDTLMAASADPALDLDMLATGVADGTEAVENLSEGQLLEIIRSSLSENRVDLYLQPIVGLPSRKKVHYECFSRVRDSEGTIISPSQYLSLAETGGLVGTLDNLLLFRLIQLVRRLGPRRPDIRFFCNLSSYSLHDQEFFPQFIEFMSSNREFSRRIVFEIAQPDLMGLDEDVKALLHELGRQGFSFSLDQVSDTNLDVKELESHYFRWVKIEHHRLLKTFDIRGIEEYYRTLKQHGIALIASHIEGELDVIKMTDARLEYSQGFLFGEPRSVHDLTGEL